METQNCVLLVSHEFARKKPAPWVQKRTGYYIETTPKNISDPRALKESAQNLGLLLSNLPDDI
jgi:hypothetical protein